MKQPAIGPPMTRRDFLKNTGLLGIAVSLPVSGSIPVLRPPGAGPDFLSKCIRCGKCLEACPYDSIRLLGIASGTEIYTPYIDTLKTPCYVCQEKCQDGDSRPIGKFLRCGEACPTNALQLIPNDLEALSRLPDKIKTGVAKLNRRLCIAWRFGFCGECYFNCPLKDKAMLPRPPSENVSGQKIMPCVNETACIGCGRCVYVCPVRRSLFGSVKSDGARPDYFRERYGAMVNKILSECGANVNLPAIKVIKYRDGK
ncbi:putative Ferredoxin-type protein NapG [uncultured Desulfobacterium sp.]|uniref:Putative Ferredoxin-type protein NapG n=1 Tax=uncultured Desulfobacterium sp. TaxID=201089 RepID=A0A445N0S1_9BACT|nr:putative Ferredoxin-type protein NapG [uncultured Desulfobacterium sp.]